MGVLSDIANPFVLCVCGAHLLTSRGCQKPLSHYIFLSGLPFFVLCLINSESCSGGTHCAHVAHLS